MARFLLIHGSGHGAWCWRDVLPILQGAGHEARAIDLPGHGEDKTPASEVTLDLYARAILAAITEPVVLVGHSMAGYPITLAAEMAPEKIDRLIYVCGYVPKPGLSLADMRRAGPRQPLLPAIITSPDRVTFSFRPEMTGEKFYHDCPEGTVDFANAHLCPQPIAPQETPIHSLDRWHDVPKYYVLSENDQAIPPEYQAEMTAGWPEESVRRIPTSHSPFFAAPAKLAEILMEIART